MKLKGISIFEQHVDKIVIGVAALAFVVIVGLQVLGGNSVKLESRDVAVGDVDRILSEKADALGSKLGDSAPLPVPQFADNLPLLSQKFESRLQNPMSVDSPALRYPQTYVLAAPSEELRGDVWYHQPRLEMAKMLPGVTQSADALADGVVESNPELAARFPNGQTPHDIIWATPAAAVPVGQYLAQLHAAEAASNPPRAQIPTPWYSDTLSVFDVVFERSEKRSDGSWTEPVMVKNLEPNFALRPYIDASVDSVRKDWMIAQTSDQKTQQLILQPPFYETKNEAFTPPSLDAKPQDTLDPSLGEVARLQRREKSLLDEIGREEKRLEGMGGPLEEQPKDPKNPDRGGRDKPPAQKSDPGGMGGSGGFGFNPGNAGPKGEDPKAKNKEASDKARIALTKKIKRKKESLERIQKQLADKGVSVQSATPEKAASIEINVNRDPVVVAWAHDIDVEPGKVYRYRCRVRIFNPFFARTRQLVKEQATLADRVVMESPPSDWSEEVEITPPVRFFITQASPSSEKNELGTALVEVYRLYDGQRRLREFRVQVGDRIGGLVKAKSSKSDTPPQSDIDFSTEWVVVDILNDLSASAGDQLNAESSGIVLVKRIGTNETIAIRSPVVDAANPERERLKIQAEEAEGS